MDLAPKEASAAPSTHRRTPSASSILSKMGLTRAPADNEKAVAADPEGERDAPLSIPTSGSAMSSIVQQQKTRRRRGSLRKVALLGRGAQRDKRDMSPLVTDASNEGASASHIQNGGERDALGLNVHDTSARASADGFAGHTSSVLTGALAASNQQHARNDRESQPSYISTTDEEDSLQLPPSTGPSRPGLPVSSGSESYFSSGRAASQARRPGFQQAKSPLSYSGLPTTPGGPAPDSDWDYSETEWWGWVVLTVTWFVFVVGMGSCLDVWSWAWDIGKTPYAPPELEDDPTLPIVGYYPALIILSCVMAWVWVVVAWVGMKYFRHAKISGD